MRAACVREGTPPLTIALYVGAGSGLCRACYWLHGALICNCTGLTCVVALLGRRIVIRSETRVLLDALLPNRSSAGLS